LYFLDLFQVYHDHLSYTHVATFILLPDAQTAQQALEGRYFAGRSIKAEFFDEAMFMSNRLSG